MRLLYHYHIPVLRTNDGNLMTFGFQGRFIDSLAEHCAEIYLLMHQAGSGESRFDYVIKAKNVHFISIGTHTSVPMRMFSIPKVKRIIKDLKGQIDSALVRGPSPLLPAICSAIRHIPTALLIVGDYLDGIDDHTQPLWRKQMIKMWVHWNMMGQNREIRRNLVFVNSKKLYDKLKPSAKEIIEIRTTNLFGSDFYEIDDRCVVPPYRLLYTGRIDEAKGLIDLIKAVQMLRKKNVDAVLDLVGWSNGNSAENVLKKEVKDRQLDNYIVFHGFKALGPELFSFYKKADIFVLPSYAEGFPRSIWEAMAHSLPVIATRVGSIPYYLEDKNNALLVPSKDSRAIEQAVRELIENVSLRKQMIISGRKLARMNTLEKQTENLVAQFKKYVAKTTPGYDKTVF